MSESIPFKPKVLFIIHLPPPIHGAAVIGSYIKNSHLVNDELDADYVNLATSAKLHEVGKRNVNKVSILFSLLKSMVRLLSRNKFDICYVTLTSTGIGFYKDLIIVTILKAAGKKIVYHFHNKGVLQASRSWINRQLYRYAFRNTKSILLSTYLYHDIKMYVKETDVFYCPNGIPVAPEYKKEEALTDMSSIKCKLLFLSNMMYAKGVYVLLEALKILKERQLSYECRFVGAWADITENEFMKKVADNGLTSAVFAFGPKYGNDKHVFFKEADIFVFPTLNETFALVNLEAMQFELPVVSTPEGGIPDVVIDGETGFLVPKEDAEALADKLELLIQQPGLRRKMGMAGKKRFERLFTLDKFERKLTTIIKKAIDLNLQ